MQRVELDEKCNNFKFTKDEIHYVEEATQNQSTSSVWYVRHCGRIAGSTVYSVLHTDIDNPSKSVIDKICQKHILSMNILSMNIQTLQWGRENENLWSL